MSLIREMNLPENMYKVFEPKKKKMKIRVGQTEAMGNMKPLENMDMKKLEIQPEMKIEKREMDVDGVLTANNYTLQDLEGAEGPAERYMPFEPKKKKKKKKKTIKNSIQTETMGYMKPLETIMDMKKLEIHPEKTTENRAVDVEGLLTANNYALQNLEGAEGQTHQSGGHMDEDDFQKPGGTIEEEIQGAETKEKNGMWQKFPIEEKAMEKEESQTVEKTMEKVFQLTENNMEKTMEKMFQLTEKSMEKTMEKMFQLTEKNMEKTMEKMFQLTEKNMEKTMEKMFQLTEKTMEVFLTVEKTMETIQFQRAEKVVEKENMLQTLESTLNTLQGELQVLASAIAREAAEKSEEKEEFLTEEPTQVEKPKGSKKMQKLRLEKKTVDTDETQKEENAIVKESQTGEESTGQYKWPFKRAGRASKMERTWAPPPERITERSRRYRTDGSREREDRYWMEYKAERLMNRNRGRNSGQESAEGDKPEKKAHPEFYMDEIYGDLFRCPPTDSLAHCVSQDLHMGKGIQKTFRDRFNHVPFLKDQNKGVGDVAVLEHDGRFIYYLVTKEAYYKKPTYMTLHRSLEAMKEHCVANQVTNLSMPGLGCGLDKLWWPRVKEILTDVFQDIPIYIKAYYLDD